MRYDPKQVFTSPAGPASFPNLTKPRQYKNKGVFSYDTGLILTNAQFTEPKHVRGLPDDVSFEQALKEWGTLSVERHRFEPRALPYGPLLEKDADGNRMPVDGFTVVKFKVDATTETRKGDVWDRRPKLFDINGAPITQAIEIPGGSVIRVKFTVWLSKGGDKAGVKLQPVSIQIVKLRESGESFEKYDGGDADETFEPSFETPTGEPTKRGDF